MNYYEQGLADGIALTASSQCASYERCEIIAQHVAKSNPQFDAGFVERVMEMYCRIEAEASALEVLNA